MYDSQYVKKLYEKFVLFYNEKEFLKIDDYYECKFTKYKFNRKNLLKSIYSFFRQTNYNKFFILINRYEIKKLYEEHFYSFRDINKFLKQKYDINLIGSCWYVSINRTDINIKSKHKHAYVKRKSVIIKENIKKFYIKKIQEFNPDFNFNKMTLKEMNKFYRNVINSPFELRKRGMTWKIIEKKNISKYDKSTRNFIDNFIKTGVYDFDGWFKVKCLETPIILNSLLVKRFGKKLFKYFGKDLLIKEIKKFYKNNDDNYRYLKLRVYNKNGQRKANYKGYVDGHSVNSLNEAILTAYLIDNNINVKTNSCYLIDKKINKKYFYDIYLIDYDVYIEYLGMLDDDIYKKHNGEKIKYLMSKNINLIYSNSIDEIITKIEKIVGHKINKKMNKMIIIEE